MRPLLSSHVLYFFVQQNHSLLKQFQHRRMCHDNSVVPPDQSATTALPSA